MCRSLTLTGQSSTCPLPTVSPNKLNTTTKQLKGQKLQLNGKHCQFFVPTVLPFLK